MYCDVVLERCDQSPAGALCAAGLRTTGACRPSTPSTSAKVCGDKLLTSTALISAGVPSPRTVMAFTPEAALEAIDEIGLSVVMKPAVGSWGRLLAQGQRPRRGGSDAGAQGDRSARSIMARSISRNTSRSPAATFALLSSATKRSAPSTATRRTGSPTPRAAARRAIARSRRRSTRCAARRRGRSAAAWSRSICLKATRGLLVNEVNYTMEFRNSIDTDRRQHPGPDRRLCDHGGRGEPRSSRSRIRAHDGGRGRLRPALDGERAQREAPAPVGRMQTAMNATEALNYDDLAAAYTQHRRAHPGVVADLLQAAAPGAHSRVLEIGCGTANYLAAIQRASDCTAWGIDPSAEMLAQACGQPATLPSRTGARRSAAAAGRRVRSGLHGRRHPSHWRPPGAFSGSGAGVEAGRPPLHGD